MDTLKALALSKDVEGLAFRSLSDEFIAAISKVSKVSSKLTSGLEPIIGHWVADTTVVGLGYAIWQAPDTRLEDVARLTQGISAQIVRLVSDTDESWQHASSKNGGDVLFHLTAACATRLDSDAPTADSTRLLSDNVIWKRPGMDSAAGRTRRSGS